MSPEDIPTDIGHIDTVFGKLREALRPLVVQRLAEIEPHLESLDDWDVETYVVARIHLDIPFHDTDTPEEIADCELDLLDTLNAFAPDGYTFGNHDGDALCYGYWPIDD